MRTAIMRPAAAAFVAVALFAGCSGSESGTGVATLSDGATDDATAASADGTELTEEKALEFAQCMRDNGVEDFADPTVDADGNVQLFGGGGGGAATGDGTPTAPDEGMQTAIEACSDLLEGITLGGGRGGPGGGFGDNTELQDALVEYSECLRDEGLDVGDLTLGGPGGGQGGDGAPPDGSVPEGPPPEGEQGPGGDPSDRIIESLGLDPDDPAVAAAIEKCQPLLEEAFSGFGPNADDESAGS